MCRSGLPWGLHSRILAAEGLEKPYRGLGFSAGLMRCTLFAISASIAVVQAEIPKNESESGSFVNDGVTICPAIKSTYRP